MSAPPEGVWVDDRTPDPSWWPPSAPPPTLAPPGGPEDDPGRGRWRPHPLLVGLAVLALVLVLVWAMGGFRRRTDLQIPVEPGQRIATGPYEFTFTKASAQRVNRYGSDPVVEVKVIGTGRTTGDEAISPSFLDPMFVARAEINREVQESDGQRFGPGGGFDSGNSFTPGLPPVEYTVTFEFSPNYQPAATLLFGIAELEYTDRSLLGTGEETWNNGDRQFMMTLPVTQLPDQD